MIMIQVTFLTKILASVQGPFGAEFNFGRAKLFRQKIINSHIKLIY